MMNMLEQETLVILDYGSQYTQLIARRSRELGVYSIILPYSASLEEIKQLNPKGIVLSGGPNSVFDEGAPALTEGLLDQNIPVLGVCYGMQLIARKFGGEVEESKSREYGKAMIIHKDHSEIINKAFDGSTIWMSHGTHVSRPPEGFVVTAMSDETIASIENPAKNLYCLQFHPEVAHTDHGKEIIEAFIDKCGFSKSWLATSIIDEQVNKIKEVVGENSVICALSGGVDSSVAATLVNKAIGEKQTCIFVDTGLLRKNEYEEVLEIYQGQGLNVVPIRAGERFLSKLEGISDPEEKRKIIGNEFIAVFDEEAAKLANVGFLVQGTLYPDVIESVSVNGPSVTIKSHHNVGGLPEKMNLKLIEPLRELFKDEVRQIGAELELPQKITARQPFPGPGLAVRIIDKITPEAIAVLQEADAIVREEILSAKAEENLWQYFAVLLPVKSVGVMGDGRTHEQVIALRVVESTDGMTADWAKLPYELLAKISSRIVSEVRGVNRVVYDITSKPPGTIEWE